ncbi:MAG: M1 family aminopeptidase [Bacteroidetes bacterium]|nr:M1 family aminopeptidase [Bacteroidota bacterium]
MKKATSFFVFICLMLPSFLFSQHASIKALSSDSIDVLHYDIHLDISHTIQNQLIGFTEVKITPKINNIGNISLELLYLSIDSIKLNNSNNSFTYINNKILIPLSTTANINDTLNVKVFYHGTPHIESSGWGGFHISSGLSYNLGISFADNLHNYGKCFFPCIDDFIDRAFYDYYITVDSTKFAVCGGTLMSIINDGSGNKTFHWKFNNTIPAYLASVAVYNYVPVNGTFLGINGNTPTAIYVLPADTNKAKASFIHLNDILQTFEHYWGPYRWERVGYVATTLGAMEHATNIAYPASSIDGTLNDEYLYAHELSHQWFGNLITCSSAEDMWINEGWATYNEALYKEGVYGKKAYKDYLRTKLKKVLQLSHIDDNGYRAVYGIPSAYTYGETVYQKGSCVVQSLRAYLGDSLFFGGIKQLLNQFAFSSVSSLQIRDFLSNYSGINLNDFFNFHVFSPGFTHYSIDSMISFSCPANHYVYLHQRLKGATAFANSNVVEITFMNNNWQKYTDTIHFNGEYGMKAFQMPFVPTIAMVDMEEKLADATTDKYEIIKNTGIVDYSESLFQLDIQQIADSALVRVVHNWVKPDSLKTANPEIKRISPIRYWLVEGIFPAGFNAKGKFYYNCQTPFHLEYQTLLPSYLSTDSLILLYRKNNKDDWHIINFIKDDDMFSGYMTTENLQQGEYVLGVGKPFQSGLNELKQKQNNKKIELFPNPNNGEFNIRLNNINEDIIVKLYTQNGALIDSFAVSKKNIYQYRSKTKLKAGNYLIQFSTLNGKIIDNEQLVVIKD